MEPPPQAVNLRVRCGDRWLSLMMCFPARPPFARQAFKALSPADTETECHDVILGCQCVVVLIVVVWFHCFAYLLDEVLQCLFGSLLTCGTAVLAYLLLRFQHHNIILTDITICVLTCFSSCLLACLLTSCFPDSASSYGFLHSTLHSQACIVEDQGCVLDTACF